MPKATCGARASNQGKKVVAPYPFHGRVAEFLGCIPGRMVVGIAIERPAKNRKMSIQAIDIHEFKDRQIVRTWHTEDWMSGLHQLGVFDK